MPTKSSLFVLLLVATLASGPGARADSVTLTGSQGFTVDDTAFVLSALARFDLQGSNLTVTLTNTSTGDVTIPAEVLTGVFFNFPSDVSLSPVRALLATGSTVWNGPLNGGNLSSEWAYAEGLANPGNSVFLPLGSGIEGISSSGLGIFGPSDRFDTVGNLQGPDNPDGLQYGITSAGDDPSTGNTAIMTNALIMNSMVFSFNVDGALDVNSIRSVVFQYGTATTEPSFRVFRGQPRPPVPEPASLLLLAGGLAVAALRRKLF